MNYGGTPLSRRIYSPPPRVFKDTELNKILSEQDRKYIFTEDAKKAMVDRNSRNKRINDQAPNVNTRKRYYNNVLAATKT